jgi:hypothetical protein
VLAEEHTTNTLKASVEPLLFSRLTVHSFGCAPAALDRSTSDHCVSHTARELLGPPPTGYMPSGHLVAFQATEWPGHVDVPPYEVQEGIAASSGVA